MLCKIFIFTTDKLEFVPFTLTFLIPALDGATQMCRLNFTSIFQNGDKETALHSASQFGHLQTAQLLLEHLADPNIKNLKDETPLDLAALYGR